MGDIRRDYDTKNFIVYKMDRDAREPLYLAIRKQADGGQSYRREIKSDCQELFRCPAYSLDMKDLLASSSDSQDTRYGFLWGQAYRSPVIRLSNVPADYVDCLRWGVRVPQDLSGCSLRQSTALRDIQEFFESNTIYTTHAMMHDIDMGNPHSLYIYDKDELETRYDKLGVRLTDSQIVLNHSKSHIYRRVLLENDGWSFADECRIFVGFNPFNTDWNEVEEHCENMCL